MDAVFAMGARQRLCSRPANAPCAQLRCPCGRPRNPKLAKAAQLRTIRLKLPVPADEAYERPSNLVVTSKYTPWDFAIRACLLQFRRAINLFFFCIVILLLVGYYAPNLFETPYQPWGTLLVLVFVIGVTMIFEGYDDTKRHRQDKKSNGSPVVLFGSADGVQVKTTWGALCPGDIVLLRDRDLVPADVIVLHTARDGMAYIETSGIDGETNLKIKKAHPDLAALVTSKLEWPLLQGHLDYEEPNPFLSFSGTLHEKQKTIPIGFDSLLLRGSEVRNTAWVLALVAYAGHETKLILSKRATPSKFASLDLLTNRLIIGTVIQMFVYVAVSLSVLFVDVTPTQTLWYFQGFSMTDGFSIPGQLSYFFTFVIIYSGVVPISLYVVVELANAMQSLLLMLDLDIYDAHTDTPTSTKCTNLISEIGQVSHVFSDKTGTLTQNVMRLVGLSVGGRRFGVQVPDAMPAADSETAMPPPVAGLGKRQLDIAELFSALVNELDTNEAARELLLALSVCHTVIMDRDRDGKPRYNAEGPDEEALVKAAKALGHELSDTAGERYVIEERRAAAATSKRTFEVLAVLPFTSDRKRMSVLLRDLESGQATLWCKGADSVISELAGDTPAQLMADLDAFAQNGLRTLLVAKRELTETEVNEFTQVHAKALAVVGPARTEALQQAHAMVECQLTILGATAIEDALQEGVPAAIQTMRDAGIKVWVLTGDKVDTAINIAFASRLLDSRMTRIHLDSTTTAELEAKIDAALEALEKAAAQPLGTVAEIKGLAVVVTGKAVELLLAKQKGNAKTQRKFVLLAGQCSVVLACRVSPAQKALIVRAASVTLPGRRPPVTLAIGDGANDVAMIQEARVGVGISGKEGLQAANSADFSIAQFRFLVPLLFKHGRWSYRRNAKLIIYVCYSWQLLNWGVFFYSFQSMQSGQSVYVNTYYGTMFAWICNYIVVGIAWFDRDVGFATVLKQPRAYDVGRLNQDISVGQVVLGVFVRPLVHAAILYAFLMTCTPPVFVLDVLGSSFFMATVILCTLREGMITLTWTWVIILAFVAFFVIYPVSVTIIDTSVSLTGPGVALLGVEPTAYAVTALAVGGVVAVEYGLAGARRLWYPRKLELLMEVDRGYAVPETRPRLHGVMDAVEAMAEGGDRVVVLPVKLLRAALSKRFKGARGKDETLMHGVVDGRRSSFDYSGVEYNSAATTHSAAAAANNGQPDDPGEV